MALVVMNVPANSGNVRIASFIPGLGGSPGGGHSNPLQYSCLENPMDRGEWGATVQRVTKSWTQLKWLSRHAQLTYIIVSVQVCSKLISFIYSCMCVCVCVCVCVYTIIFLFFWALSQVTLEVKNLPANAGDVRDTGLIPGLGRSPAEGMATHSSFLAWTIPWTEHSGMLQSMGCKELNIAEVT